ncbi:Acetylcholinesterase-1, partial [Araneus ventricosus]
IDAKVLSVYDFYLKPTYPEDFVPQFGDEILPVNPRKAIFEGKFKCTELLIGNNQDEAGLLLTTGDPQLFGFFGEKNPSINKTSGKDLIRKIFKDFPDPESVVRHYLPDDVPEYAFDFVRYQVATAAGDFLVVCPDVYHAEKCAEKGGKVYSYFWVHRPSNSPWAPWMGAVHFTEVQFIFGRPFLHPSDYQAGESGISEQMVQIWSNFVKNGDPGCSDHSVVLWRTVLRHLTVMYISQYPPPDGKFLLSVVRISAGNRRSLVSILPPPKGDPRTKNTQQQLSSYLIDGWYNIVVNSYLLLHSPDSSTTTLQQCKLLPNSKTHDTFHSTRL